MGGDAEEQDGLDPELTTSRTSGIRLPMESWNTPGMEAMGFLMFSPAMTKYG